MGKSQEMDTYWRVQDVLAGRPIDMLYIDGDHMYVPCKEDWGMYAPLVRPGGVVVLHDAVIEDNPTVEVYQFYREVREGRKTKLIYAGQHSTGTCMVFV